MGLAESTIAKNNWGDDMPFFDYLPRYATPFHVFLRHERIYRPFVHFLREVMRGPSPFTDSERELIGAYTSGLNDCDFCQDTHLSTAMALGVEPAILKSLMDNIDVAPVDEKMKPVLRFVKKLTEQPARIVESDLDAVRAAGWNDQALHDAIAVCGLFSYMNRLVFGHGLELADTDFEDHGKLVLNFGYRLPPRWNPVARYMAKKNADAVAQG